MQVKRDNISDTKVKLTVILGSKELSHAKEHELKESAQTVKVPGFRKGNAPLAMVEKQLDEVQFQSTVINHAINDTYDRAISEEKLRTLDQPHIEISKFVPYSDLEYTAEVEIMPKVTLGDYKKIKKSMPKITITDKDVKDVLDNLSERSSTKDEVDRQAKLKDEVVIDFQGTDKDGKDVPGSSGSDYALLLGSSSFIPGFEEGLVGLAKGQKKTLNLSFPKEYHVSTLAGTKINFDVEVKAVKEVTPAKLDDAFAATIGPFKTLDELKKDVKEQLKSQKEQEAVNKLKDEIVEDLVKKSKMVLPDVLVNDQVRALEQDFAQNLVYRGITKSEYLKQEGFADEDEWKDKEIKPQAKRRVSVGMVLAEVAEKEKIEASKEDIDNQIAIYKQQYQKQAAQFDTPEMRREVSSRVLTEKTVDRLFEIATAAK